MYVLELYKRTGTLDLYNHVIQTFMLLKIIQQTFCSTFLLEKFFFSYDKSFEHLIS